MPGYNHPADCLCGWCYKEKSIQSQVFRRAVAPTFESITTPNWSCPVCGAAVFYYSNTYGSRVYFDDLGPPWTKHGCTSSEPGFVPKSRDGTPPTQTLTPPWRVYKYIRSKFEDDWVALHLEDVRTGALFRLLVERHPHIPLRHAVFVHPFDDDGYTWIEFIMDDLSVTRMRAWEYQRWYLSTSAECVQRRSIVDS